MDEQLYPDNLFSAVASNILAKFNGVPGGATIQKEAAEAYAVPHDVIVAEEEKPNHAGRKAMVIGGAGIGGLLGGARGIDLGGLPGILGGGVAGAAGGALLGLAAHGALVSPFLSPKIEERQIPVFAPEDEGRIDPKIDLYALMKPRTNPEVEKQAADQTPDVVNQFLSQYRFTPAQFAGDPVANKQIAPQEREAMQKLRQAFDEQARMLGQTTPQLARNRELSLQNIHRQAEDAKINQAIQRTMAVAGDNPERFGQMVDLSNRSQRALQKSKLDVLGTLGGGAAGAGLGALLGKSTGGRVATGLAGLAGGALVGREAGRRAEQNQTGYAYSDVLKPYQVADRMDKRQEADVRK